MKHVKTDDFFVIHTFLGDPRIPSFIPPRSTACRGFAAGDGGASPVPAGTLCFPGAEQRLGQHIRVCGRCQRSACLFVEEKRGVQNVVETFS